MAIRFKYDVVKKRYIVYANSFEESYATFKFANNTGNIYKVLCNEIVENPASTGIKISQNGTITASEFIEE